MRERNDVILENNAPKPRKMPKLQVDQVQKEHLMVMQDDSIILFVKEGSEPIERELSKFCDPLSKPAHIHEYILTQKSLLRAKSLGYDTQKIKSFLNSHLKKPVSQKNELFLKKFLSGSCPHLYLKQTQKGNYYVFEFTKQWWEDRDYSHRDRLSSFFKQNKHIQQGQQTEKNQIIEKVVVEHKHNSLAEQLFQNLKAPVKAERDLPFDDYHDPKATIADIEINFEKHPLHCKKFYMSLRAFTQLRYYQSQALKEVVRIGENKKVVAAKSGYIVLPCGAGKTLLGISILASIRRESLIVCSSDSGADQWRREIQKWTQGFPAEQIIIMTAQSDFVWKRNQKKPRIFISTYSNLKSKVAGKEIKSEHKWLKYMPWGLIIFDECQTLPAEQNRQIMNILLAHVKIGLTATPMREDDEIKALNFMIGPQLYSGDWKTFVQSGYLANPKCIQIRTKMTQYFAKMYERHYSQRAERQFLYQVNPNKVKALMYLLRYHENLKDNVIVFCDNIKLIKYLAEKLKKPLLMGQSSSEQRNLVFDLFREEKIRTLFLSRIGDEAIDLPNANVGIEVNIQHGSRKQMLQRLGRIMRQKQASSSTSYNALFYTIISDETDEPKHFFKRYKCLIDEGFLYDLRFFDYPKLKEEGLDDMLKIDPTADEYLKAQFRKLFTNDQNYLQELKN